MERKKLVRDRVTGSDAAAIAAFAEVDVADTDDEVVAVSRELSPAPQVFMYIARVSWVSRQRQSDGEYGLRRSYGSVEIEISTPYPQKAPCVTAEFHPYSHVISNRADSLFVSPRHRYGGGDERGRQTTRRRTAAQRPMPVPWPFSLEASSAFSSRRARTPDDTPIYHQASDTFDRDTPFLLFYTKHKNTRNARNGFILALLVATALFFHSHRGNCSTHWKVSAKVSTHGKSKIVSSSAGTLVRGL